MTRALAIALLALRRELRNKYAIFFMILLPVLMMWLIGTLFGGNGSPEAEAHAARAVVVDADGSDLSARMVAALQGQSEVAVQVEERADAAHDAVRSNRADAAVIIPAGFGAALQARQPTQVELAYLPENNRSATVMQVADAAGARVSAGLDAADRAESVLAANGLPPAAAQSVRDRALAEAERIWSEEPPAVTVQPVPAAAPRPQAGQSISGYQQSALGFMVTFVMWALLYGAGAILEERQAGTWGRLLTTPAARWQILLGKLLGAAFFSVVQVAVLIGFGRLVLRVDYGAAPLALGLILLALIWAGLGIGLLVATLVRTQGQLMALAPLIGNVTGMIGGCYWPIEIVPQGMQTLARLTPHGWGMAALSDVVIRGAGLADVWLPILVLAAMGLVSLAIAVPRVRFE